MFKPTPKPQCLVRLKDCILKNHLKDQKGIFANALNFEVYEKNDLGLPSTWGIMGSKKTELLNALAMRYLPSPALSRTYPFMSEKQQYDKVEYLNFKESSGLDKVHLSARYESLSFKGTLEMSDDVNSVRNYIIGSNNYNSNTRADNNYADELIGHFNLSHLTQKWINSLSNGQLRRARIAKALIRKPKLLIIDDPFLGLDPKQTQTVSQSLYNISNSLETSIVLGLRLQDTVPEWVTHVATVDNDGIIASGEKSDVVPEIQPQSPPARDNRVIEISNQSLSNPYIEFNNASVIYRGLPVLKDFNWKVPRGSTWRILGENGTGKTTILSLITVDHPQSWRGVLSLNGKVLKSGAGLSFFDINNNIGVSSPEIHALVPGSKTMNQIIKNGLVQNVGNCNFHYKGDHLQFSQPFPQVLAEFSDIIHEFGDTPFRELSITHQKLTLFLRALAKNPPLIILDEAFSCIDDINVMNKCHRVLTHYYRENTVLVIGHIDWELPSYDHMIHLIGDENRSYRLYKVEAKQ